MANMASGIARVRAPYDDIDDDVDYAAQHGGHTYCSFTDWKSMSWSIDTCQIKVSTYQYHVTISRAQV